MKRDGLGGFGIGRQPALLDCGFRQPIVPHRAGVELHHRQIAVAGDGGDLVVGAASLGEHDGGVLAQPMRGVCPLSPAADKAAQMLSPAMCQLLTNAL